jgi:flagellar basal-body rod protein FlgG
MSSRALRTAASGMYAQQVNIEVISNNISNINTTSFKKQRADFTDLMYQEIIANPQSTNIPGISQSSAEKVQVGNGVKVSSSKKIFEQGSLTRTGHQLDVAIHGDGFFQVRKSDGSYAYTRDGSFSLSGDGSLVTSNGNRVEPGFTINSDVQSVQIAKDGTVSVTEANGDTFELGQIELAKFVNPAGLKALGDNMYAETPASGNPLLGTPGSEGFGNLSQGYLEGSNVDIVEEMISMITAQRAYEINSKTIKTVEDMISMANNLSRG